MINPKSRTTTSRPEPACEKLLPPAYEAAGKRAGDQHDVRACHLEEGQVVEATIKRVEHYGAFVDVDGLDGLLPVIEISWTRFSHPSDLLAPGQRIEAKVLRITPKRQIVLSKKALQPDPWLDIKARYPLRAMFIGRVTSIADYGAFVELEPAIEGLIHLSEMLQAEKNVHPREIVSIAQELEVQILQVDPVKRRISLGFKQALSTPREDSSPAT